MFVYMFLCKCELTDRNKITNQNKQQQKQEKKFRKKENKKQQRKREREKQERDRGRRAILEAPWISAHEGPGDTGNHHSPPHKPGLRGLLIAAGARCRCPRRRPTRWAMTSRPRIWRTLTRWAMTQRLLTRGTMKRWAMTRLLTRWAMARSPLAPKDSESEDSGV